MHSRYVHAYPTPHTESGVICSVWISSFWLFTSFQVAFKSTEVIFFSKSGQVTFLPSRRRNTWWHSKSKSGHIILGRVTPRSMLDWDQGSPSSLKIFKFNFSNCQTSKLHKYTNLSCNVSFSCTQGLNENWLCQRWCITDQAFNDRQRKRVKQLVHLQDSVSLYGPIQVHHDTDDASLMNKSVAPCQLSGIAAL